MFTGCNLWISYRRQLLVSKSVDGLLVFTQIQLGANKNDRSRRAVVTHLRKPLLTTHTRYLTITFYITESSKYNIRHNPAMLTYHCLMYCFWYS